MSKIKIIALFGKSGAGKDTIQKRVVSSYPDKVCGIVSCTTRPKRDYEIDGIDYHFITNEAFAKHVLDGTMIEATDFRGWFYGTPIWALSDKVNIGVFNIAGIECIIEDPRLEVIPVLIDVPDKIRLIRSLNREFEPNCAEICRRFQTDEKDFSDIPFVYLTYNNIGLDPEGKELRTFFDNLIK